MLFNLNNKSKDKKFDKVNYIKDNKKDYQPKVISKKQPVNSFKSKAGIKKQNSNILIMNDSHYNPISRKKEIIKDMERGVERGVNIDLNASDSERKSLCLKSIQINMKKSKINLELSSKPSNNNNERASYTTNVNTSAYINAPNIELQQNNTKNNYYKNPKGHYISTKNQFLTRSHVENFVKHNSV